MKVIDLLNKIANTRDYNDIPKKVKITTGSLKDEYRIWVWDGLWYTYEEDGTDVCICTEKLDLNDEVEILTDIRKLRYKVREPRNFEDVVYITEDLVNKINEIIDGIDILKEKIKNDNNI